MASQYWRQYDNSKRFSKLDVFYNYLGSDPQSSVLASLKSQALNSFENHLNNVMQVSKNVEPYRRIAEYEKEMQKHLDTLTTAQRDLAALLKKAPKEESLVESAGGKWSNVAWNLVNDMESTTELKGIAKAFIKWLSDKDVGEFLHQTGYVEYEDKE